MTWLKDNEAQTNAIRNLATTLGILIGGSFALYKFVFEGAFSNRLQPNVFADVVHHGDQVFIKVGVTAENIGRRKVRLDAELTSLGVSFAASDSDGWTEPYGEPVMEDQDVVRPGETVTDQLWVETEAEGLIAAQLEFYLSDLRSRPFSGFETVWIRREIVSLVEEEGTIP